MHIEAVAVPLEIGGIEVAPKWLCISLAMEKKVRQFGNSRLRERRKRKVDKNEIQGEKKGSKGV